MNYLLTKYLQWTILSISILASYNTQAQSAGSDTALMIIDERPYWVVLSTSNKSLPSGFEGNITKASTKNSDFVTSDSILTVWIEKYSIIQGNEIKVASEHIEKLATIDRSELSLIVERGEEIADKHLIDQKKLDRRVKIIGISIIVAAPLTVAIVEWLNTPILSGGLHINW